VDRPTFFCTDGCDDVERLLVVGLLILVGITAVWVWSIWFMLSRALRAAGSHPRTALLVGLAVGGAPAATVWWLSFNDYFSPALVLIGIAATALAAIGALVTWRRSARPTLRA
jgi:hypothetical protein